MEKIESALTSTCHPAESRAQRKNVVWVRKTPFKLAAHNCSHRMLNARRLPRKRRPVCSSPMPPLTEHHHSIALPLFSSVPFLGHSAVMGVCGGLQGILIHIRLVSNTDLCPRFAGREQSVKWKSPTVRQLSYEKLTSEQQSRILPDTAFCILIRVMKQGYRKPGFQDSSSSLVPQF